jgi:hypothetical protein
MIEAELLQPSYKFIPAGERGRVRGDGWRHGTGDISTEQTVPIAEYRD